MGSVVSCVKSFESHRTTVSEIVVGLTVIEIYCALWLESVTLRSVIDFLGVFQLVSGDCGGGGVWWLC